MKLSDIIQEQNSRVGALESSELDDNLLIPKIRKIYEGIKVTSRIRVAKATYYKCGEIVCGPDQKNTKSYIETYY